MDREWTGVTWKDDAGNTIHLPFCRANEVMTESPRGTDAQFRTDIIFTFGMKRTFADGRPPNDALCARVHVSHESNKRYWAIDVEDLGGALTRLLYCEVLRLIAGFHEALEAELHRCEALLASDQTMATPAPITNARPPLTDPIDQAIYSIIAAADFEITDGQISAQLADQHIKLTRERVNQRRNAIRKMGYQVR